ncbi:tetratricopeptide repeat protein [Streptomyces vinaceus]|uniref:tetratricopeptide repeat protein n=1 Tax=Streptomyces vinaceus TaxID=1960 RepID=UPI00369624BD
MTVPRPPGGEQPAQGFPGGDAEGARIVQNVYSLGGFAYGAINADVHVHGDGRPVYVLAEHEPPDGDPDPAWIEQPSRLLNAGNAVVPFTGREAEVGELIRWRGPGSGGHSPSGDRGAGPSGRALAVRWLHGPGGRGKTRLADHFAARSVRQGWKTIVIRHGGTVLPESARSHDARAGHLRGLLVLVDYADRWPLRDLAWLLANSMFDGGRRGGDHEERVPVRVLLLARTPHAWPAVKSMTAGRADTSECELAPLAEEPGDRERMFAIARTEFAELYGRPDAASAPCAVSLTDPAFGLTLTIHMAALVAVDAHVHGRTAPRDPAGMSAYLLEREHENWRRLYENGAAGLDFRTAPDDMASVAFVATLTGASTWEAAAKALERAGVADVPGTVRSLLRDHARVYPPLDPRTVLEPLYPDRLAEDFLALTVPGHTVSGYRADAWAAGVPEALLTAPGAAAVAPRAVTLLASAADRWPHLAEQVLHPLLRQHPDVALDAGSAALVAVSAIEGSDREVLEAIERAAFRRLGGIPHVDLDTGLAAVAVRLAALVEPGASDAGRAGLYRHLVLRLGRAGRWAEALMYARRSVDLHGHPAAPARDRAGALSALAVTLAHAGEHAEAMERSRQAVDLYEALVRADPDAHAVLLAEALGNHANRLAEAGQRREALKCSTRSVELIGSALPESLPFPRIQSLSTSTALANHATLLSEEGQHEQARDFYRRAKEQSRGLSEGDHAVTRPMEARLSLNQSLLDAAAGDLVEAVAGSAVAVEHLTELAEINPGSHLPDLASALATHTGHLWRSGLREEALAVSRQAIAAWGKLADQNPGAHRVGLVSALRNHAVFLAQSDRREDALACSHRALGLAEELSEESGEGASGEPERKPNASGRGSHLPELARAQWSYAFVRSVLDTDLGDGLIAAARAVRTFLDLAKQDPEAYTADLLGGYALVADLLDRLGRGDEAAEVRLTAARRRAEPANAGRPGADGTDGTHGPEPEGLDAKDHLERAYRAEAESGHIPAMIHLGRLLEQANRMDEAEPWLRRAAETGQPTAIVLLAGALLTRGRADEAEPWLERSARTGDVTAMSLLGERLAGTGRGPQAEPWLRKAADAGDTTALYGLGVLLQTAGRADEAEPWLRQAARAGHPRAAGTLGILLYDSGRAPEAEPFLRQAADAGSASAMSNLGTLLYTAGRTREAEDAYRRAVDAGFDRAQYDLAVLMENTGRTAEAERWYRRAAEAGHLLAVAALATRLCEAGRLREAEPWLRRASDAGNLGSMVNLGLLLGRTGRAPEAEPWLRRAAEAGETGAMGPLGSLLCELGKWREAEPWLRRAGDAGDVTAMANMGYLLYHGGRKAEAEQWYMRAAAAGDATAAKLLSGRLFRGAREKPRRRWGFRAPD